MDAIKTALFISIVLLVIVIMFEGMDYLNDKMSYKIAIEPMKEKLSEYILDIEKEGYLSPDLKEKIKKDLEFGTYTIEIKGTEEKVEAGNPVFLSIDVYEGRSGGSVLFPKYRVVKLENFLLEGVAK